MWKHSKIRFYILNALWNYKFWLFAEKIYREKSHSVDEEGSFDLDDVSITGHMKYKKKTISSRRFVGYMYDGMMHLDNPGFRHTVDKGTWNAWKKKGLMSR